MTRRSASQCCILASLMLAATLVTHPARAEDSDWEFMVAPYAWAFGLTGDTGVGDHVASIDESFLECVSW